MTRWIKLSWCRWSLIGLLLLQPIWYLLINPPNVWPIPITLVLTMTPLMLLLPGVWQLHGRTLVIAGCLLLMYFSYAVMEVYANPDAQIAASLQILLIVIYFTALPTIRRRPKPGAAPPDKSPRV
ncbi:MAG: DUF2069 domain-containing protein [Wenzhouxiangella sp.]